MNTLFQFFYISIIEIENKYDFRMFVRGVCARANDLPMGNYDSRKKIKTAECQLWCDPKNK